MTIKPALFAILASLPLVANADEFQTGDIAVSGLTIFVTSPSARAAGGYMTITKTGDSTDQLVAVEADFPRVEVHDTTFEDGVATMHQLPTVEIAPGETLFKRGGRHVMIMGLGGDSLEVGDAVPATLIFQDAGRLDVVFEVVARPSE